MKCIHNNRTRYSNGFFCDDCKTFFGEDTPTYRSDELLSDLWCVLHNLNAERGQQNLERISEIDIMKDKIGIGIYHDNYEEIIAEAETLIAKYGKNSKSATLILSGVTSI